MAVNINIYDDPLAAFRRIYKDLASESGGQRAWWELIKRVSGVIIVSVIPAMKHIPH